MYRALIRSFVINKEMVTTYAKAKVIVPVIEKLLSQAKNGTLTQKRAVVKYCGNDRTSSRMIFDIAKKGTAKQNHFLKITNLPNRRGDNARMSKVELIEKIVEKEIKTGLNGKNDGVKSLRKVQEKAISEKKSPITSAIGRLSLNKKAKKK